MALEGFPVYDDSFSANADLSSDQYLLVKLVTGTNVVDLNSSTTTRPIGVLLNKPKANQAAEVRILGRTKVYALGNSVNIAAGDYLGPDSSGKVVKKSTPDNITVGFSTEACSVDSVLISMILVPGGWFRTAA